MRTKSYLLILWALAVIVLVLAGFALYTYISEGDPTDSEAQSSEWFIDPDRPQAQIPFFADNPSFAWFGTWAGPDKIDRYLDRVPEGQQAQIVIMNAEARECAAGTHPEARRWYDRAAMAIGPRPVVVALEPDSLGTIDLLPIAIRDDCYRTLAYGLDVFSRLPSAEVYVEAKRYRWDKPAETARQLNRIGICKVKGILLNATGMSWTNDNFAYARAVDRGVPCDLRYLVNTSHNGQGPRRDREWCDEPPTHAGAGPVPRRLDSRRMLAYVNRPYRQSCWNGKVEFELDTAMSIANRHTERLGP